MHGNHEGILDTNVNATRGLKIDGYIHADFTRNVLAEGMHVHQTALKANDMGFGSA